MTLDAARFRKKPVEIEAMQFTEDVYEASVVAAWCGGSFQSEPKSSDPDDVAVWLDIPTLEGVMKANVGDWIIRGVKGEFYPCKPDIFDATYEPAAARASGGESEWKSFPARQLTGNPYAYHAYVGRTEPEMVCCGKDHRHAWDASACADARAAALNRSTPSPDAGVVLAEAVKREREKLRTWLAHGPHQPLVQEIIDGLATALAAYAATTEER